jgi:hypothetical protein
MPLPLARWPACRHGLAAVLAIAMPLLPANAATQGELGETSRASVTIRVSIASQLRVAGIADATFASTSLDDPATASQQICLAGNSLIGAYRITAMGNGPQGGFILAGSAGSAAYAVGWAPASGQDSRPLIPGMPLESRLAPAGPGSCGPGMAAASRLDIALDPAAQRDVRQGSAYAGTLDLLIAPE